jgi:TolA-binding protein
MRAPVVSLLMAALAACAAPLEARQTDPLDAIEQLAGQGRLTDARAALERWGTDHPETAAVASELRARALMLRARLAVDPQSAESSYLAVALGYPTTSWAPEALLRLGQGLVAAAEAGRTEAAGRAAGYLDRLISDYPGNPNRPAGILWLVRAHSLAGRVARACATARDALAVGVPDEAVQNLIRLEFASRCQGDAIPQGSPDSAPSVAAATGRGRWRPAFRHISSMG